MLLEMTHLSVGGIKEVIDPSKSQTTGPESVHVIVSLKSL